MSMEHLPRKPSAVVLVVESDVLRRHEMAAKTAARWILRFLKLPMRPRQSRC